MIKKIKDMYGVEHDIVRDREVITINNKLYYNQENHTLNGECRNEVDNKYVKWDWENETGFISSQEVHTVIINFDRITNSTLIIRIPYGHNVTSDSYFVLNLPYLWHSSNEYMEVAIEGCKSSNGENWCSFLPSGLENLNNFIIKIDFDDHSFANISFTTEFEI